MRALITGVCGQDGSYLAEHLATRGDQVYGMVRGQRLDRRDWITELVPGIQLIDGDVQDSSSLYRVVEQAAPDVVYHLAAITAPALGWSQPLLMADVTGLGAVRMLDTVARVAPTARIILAGSLATHGPYGAAKAYVRSMAADYRTRGVPVTVAVLGGHHSPRRGEEFFSRRVTRAAARIANGEQGQVVLGSLTRSQDWGWARDFVTVYPTLTDLPPDDYVVSTGHPHTAAEWVRAAFAAVDLDWHDHVKHDNDRNQPTDVDVLTGQPDPRLNWYPQQDFGRLAASMVWAET